VVTGGYHRKKNDSEDLGKQSACRCGHFVSEIAHQFLRSVSVPPNTLQILLEDFMEFGGIELH
jgi:hypothetical protein